MWVLVVVIGNLAVVLPHPTEASCLLAMGASGVPARCEQRAIGV